MPQNTIPPFTETLTHKQGQKCILGDDYVSVVLIAGKYDKVHAKLKIGVPHRSDAKFSIKISIFDAVKNHE